MDAKRILTCAALFAGLALLNGPLGAAVESAIVGYTTLPMEAGKWYQVGTPFVELDEQEKPRLNTVFSEGFSEGDIVNIFDPTTSAYTTYHWKTEAGGWCKKRGAALVDVELPVGQAVFINKQVTGTVTLAGRVSVTEATTFGSEAGESWNQIVCVCPKTLKLNDIQWAGLADGDTVNIFNPDDSTYTTYHWKTAVSGWCNKRGTALVDVELPIGQALFVNKVSKGLGTCAAQ